MCGLDPDTLITRSLCRYRERGISHSVENDNYFADRVTSMGDRLLLVIGVRDQIDGIQVLNIT